MEGTSLPAASSASRPGAAGFVGPSATVAPARPVAALDVVRDYLTLTKPRIISLLLVTTVATMIVAAPHDVSVAAILWTMLGGYLAAGGAGAINHYVERDRDARMDRTCDRPIASGRIRPRAGLTFGIGLGALAVVELAIAVNPLTAALALAGLLGYVFVYTLWLKPRTPQNIVIGGAAGAVPPLVGWAAATGGVSVDALFPFAIVFLWTPPHFWALALLVSDDYARVGVPMLPVARGEAATRRLIVGYTLGLVAFTTVPYFAGLFGALYLGCALGLGAGFTALAAILAARPNRAWALRLHLASLAYLALLFAAMAIDRLV